MRAMRRHFDFLDAGECDRLFLRAPEPFDADDDPSVLGVALGATLYTPATRPALANDIARSAARGVTSVVVCLEDAVSDHELAGAERNAVAQLRDLSRSGGPLPMVYVRVRHHAQIEMVVDGLGEHAGVLTGFVAPKFTEDTGAAFFEATAAASERVGRRLLMMPVLESPELGHAETRIAALLGARRLVDKYRAHVPAVRVGATDLSATFGLRRAREFTVWDVRVVADTLAAVVNVFGRADSPYVIAGPVWEYFPSSERIFRPQLRMTPFADHEDRALRAELLAADLDGLIREVELDRANGLTGKTVIHPSHVAAVHALSVVSHEEYADAGDVLAGDGHGGVSASTFGNKMNESKPHAAWARRTMMRARVFGVIREGVSFVDLLGAVLHA